MGEPRSLDAGQRQALIGALKSRFKRNGARHPGLEWAAVQARLEAGPQKLWALQRMEETGGEPDVVGREASGGQFLFFDCAPESPQGRRSLCYDPAALEARRENKPKDSALGMAAAIGAELLTEEQYRLLQRLGGFDLKTSSWVQTPPDIRKLGGALFCDRRYGQVFVYHNGADSYYAARGFRACLRV